MVSPEALGTFRYDLSPHHYDAHCAIGLLDRRPEPYAVEYAIQRSRYCRQCGKLVEGCVPDALPGCTIDLQTMLVIVWMRIAHRMTEQSVSEAMGTLFGFSISEGEVANACRLVAEAFEPFYKTMLGDMMDAP